VAGDRSGRGPGALHPRERPVERRHGGLTSQRWASIPANTALLAPDAATQFRRPRARRSCAQWAARTGHDTRGRKITPKLTTRSMRVLNDRVAVRLLSVLSVGAHGLDGVSHAANSCTAENCMAAAGIREVGRGLSMELCSRPH
jgi:hypothetical protein